MDYKRNSNCWYKTVCTLTNCSNCIRYMEMKYLMDSSGVPSNRQIPELLDGNEDYDAFVQLADIKDNILDFVNNGDSLYITSINTGNGKTSWAIKLLLKYFDSIWAGNGFQIRGVFVHVPTFLNQLKNFNNPLSDEYKQSIFNCDLVIWDDIASTKLSEYDYSQLLSFIDVRCFAEKANIYTGNIVDKIKLQSAVGHRLASRILKGKVIELIGKDRRK